MAVIKPFRALRPKEQFASKVASRPYDVLNSMEARTEAGNNPQSFLHITKAEIDLPEDINMHSEAVYHKAKQNLDKFINDGILEQEDRACYYIYQLVMDGRSQTGLVCVSSVDDYFNDVIKKHEFTRPEKEKDRIDHMLATRAQTGNVFLAYRNVAEIDEVIAGWKQTHDPVYDFVADDGVSHAIWVINSDQVNNTLKKLFKEKVPATYIADGHHRAASAAKVRLQVEENYFLTTLFPANELRILDYNRVVKDLNGLEPAQLLEKLKKNFEVTPSDEPVAPSRLHEFGMYLKNKWYKLVSKPNTFDTDPIGVLDVTILSNNVLDKLLGITDQRTDKRIDFIGGIRGLTELEKRVDSGEMAVAFSLYPVSIEQLFNIADSGNVMPPKSTWFEPKLRDGLLTHLTRE